MLDQNDIKILEQLFKQTEKQILHTIDERLTSSEDKMFRTMDERFTSSENMILKELDRVQEHLENDIQKVQKNLDELQQYYRITKLENDNYTLLLQMYNNMQKDIDALKVKTA